MATHNKKESEQQNIFVHQETEGMEFAFGEPRATVLTSRIPVVPTTVLTYITFLIHSLYVLKFLPPFSSSTEEPIFFPSQGHYTLLSLKYSLPTFCSANTYLPSKSLLESHFQI